MKTHFIYFINQTKFYTNMNQTRIFQGKKVEDIYFDISVSDGGACFEST